MTITEQIDAAFEKIKTSFASTELIKAKADVAERDVTITSLNSQIATIKADLEKANTKIGTLETEAKTVKEAAEKATKDAEAKVEEKEKEVGKRSNIKAQEIAAGAGHTVLKEETTQTGQVADIDQLRKSLNAESDPEKRSAIAKEIRELRGHGDLFKAANADSKN